MDCTEAALLLCAAEDGEPVSSGALALAHAHCDGCPDCAAFRATLVRLHTAPAPRAPLSLVSAIITAIPENVVSQAVVNSAEITAATDAGPADQPETEPGAGAAPGLSESAGPQTATPVIELVPRKTRWATPRIAIALSSAAVLLIAIGITSGVLFSGRGAPESDMLVGSSTDGSVAAESSSIGTPSISTGETDTTAADRAVSIAPDYITFGGTVYLRSGVETPAESSLATAGAVTSSLDASGTVKIQTGYVAGADKTTLYIGSAENNEYLTFTRVSRTVGRTQYVLTTDAALAHFGEWPTLPERFGKPVTSDGAPTFRLFGFDDLGVNVYVAYGTDASAGVAIAPGTPVDDPAAGNPNWTWWEPVE